MKLCDVASRSTLVLESETVGAALCDRESLRCLSRVVGGGRPPDLTEYIVESDLRERTVVPENSVVVEDDEDEQSK